MSVLIVQLPPPRAALVGSASADYAYVQTRDGLQPDQHGTATAATLPSTGLAADVVALVPFQALSWHRVTLPKGAISGGQARLRTVLDGLLEESLLDDPSALHLALSPNVQAGQPMWVAACDKAWLKAAMAPLEAAGRRVSRIVPEFTPLAPFEPNQPRLHAVGDTDAGWLVHSSAQGVLVLPLQADAVPIMTAVTATSGQESASSGWQASNFMAEPATVSVAETLVGRPPQVQQSAQRWVLAAQTDWELAQFDLANSGAQRSVKKMGYAWRQLLHAPRWRPARWGMAALLVIQVVGLNAWAWKEKSALAALKTDIYQVLTQTFPQVKLVVDAPIQMARELALLRQSTGASSVQDLEPLLSAMGAAVPENQVAGLASLKSLDYVDGELRIKGLPPDITSALSSRLEAQGHVVQAEGDVVLFKAAKRP